MDIEMLNNLESVGEMVGALRGMSQGLDEEDYMEGLIKSAHAKTANAFDLFAAATAQTGLIKHVYEFGTAGITEGQIKFPDPTHKSARLYQHTLTGRGGNQDIGYVFRPALNRNPAPTVASTGVPSKYLQRLSQRKYVFWNKAFVMETGMSVQNKSHQSHGMLFLPFNNQPSRATPPYPNGHVMWNTNLRGNPATKVPGEHVQGNFTKLWLNWWGATGAEMIEQDMKKNIYIDIDKAMVEAERRAASQKVKPPLANNINGSAAKAAAFVKKLFGPRRVKEVT